MAVLAATIADAAAATRRRFADIRYVGQASELVVPLPPGPYTSASRSLLNQAFEKSYVDAFRRTPPTPHIEIINVRVSASIAVIDQASSAWALQGAGAHPVKAKRPVYFPEFRDFHATTVYDRYALLPGQIFDGPAVVEERESTLVIGPGGRFEQLPSGNISITIA
jgi:N-methylhydantoinase A